MSKKITLQDAMDQLKYMFPDFDEEVLRAMIFQTKGHFERTVEILLQMDSQKPTTNNSSQIVQKTTSLKHNLPDDFLMYRPSTTSQEKPIVHQPQLQPQQQPKKEVLKDPNYKISSTESKQPTTFEYLSEYAKQKFKEFQDKFGKQPDPNQQQYKSLLNGDISDDEIIENKKDK